MSYENVRLWFAKDQNDNIVTINEIEENNTYTCPVCGTELVPKAIESAKVASHFAHIDSSKCNGESMLHFWFKHKFIEVGDTFTVSTDKEHTYICKEMQIEQNYDVESKTYKPDITIITKCGERIFFEMNYSNKKEVRDYIDIWLTLKSVVVEIDIKSLLSSEMKFKALYYDGKCFNTKKNDVYYNTIGKYKEEKMKGKVDKKLKERIKKLDWFWNDLLKYKNKEVSRDYILQTTSLFEDEDVLVLLKILKKQKCIDICTEISNHRITDIETMLKQLMESRFEKYKLERNSRNFRITFDGSLPEWIDKSLYRFSIPHNKPKEWLVSEFNSYIDYVKHIRMRNNDTLMLGMNAFRSDDVEVYKMREMNSVALNVGTTHEYSFVVPDEMVTCENEQSLFQFLKNKINECVTGSSCSINYAKNIEIMENFKERFEQSLSSLSDILQNENLKIYYHWSISDTRKIQVYMKMKEINEHSRNYIFKSECEFSDNGDLYNDVLNHASTNLKDMTKDFKCRECDNRISVNKGEIAFILKKGLKLPKRCKECRRKRKMEGFNGYKQK